MQLKQVRDNIQRFGLAAGLHDVGKRAVNKVLPLRVMRAVLLTRQAMPEDVEHCDARFSCGFVDEPRLLAAAADPRFELSADFVSQNMSRGDRCYGVWDGDELAAYGWYARAPTQICSSAVLHFSPDYVYMYKGYTAPAYRGRRLHAVGMARALLAYAAEDGVRGMLSYVDSHNFASLRSCARLGYVEVGSIYLLTLPGRGRQLGWTSGRCSDYGMRIQIV